MFCNQGDYHFKIGICNWVIFHSTSKDGSITYIPLKLVCNIYNHTYNHTIGISGKSYRDFW